MDKVLKALVDMKLLRTFLDDMVIHTLTLQAHLEGAIKLIEAMKNGTLRVSLKKCELVKEEITFLGKVICRGKLKNCPTRSACIREMPLLKTYQGLQRSLGIFNYQREFIDMYAEKAQPMYDLLEIKTVPLNQLKKNGTANRKFLITWTSEALTSFELLKVLTNNALELYQPDFNIPFKLYLYQEVEGKICVVGYFSKTYTPAQRNYATGEKELLGIVKTTENFHCFLFGREFSVYTDH